MTAASAAYLNHQMQRTARKLRLRVPLPLRGSAAADRERSAPEGAGKGGDVYEYQAYEMSRKGKGRVKRTSTAMFGLWRCYEISCTFG
jgi:hypothetical protein